MCGLILVLLSLTFTLGDELKVNLTELESPVSSVHWCGASVVFTKDDETIE